MLCIKIDAQYYMHEREVNTLNFHPICKPHDISLSGIHNMDRMEATNKNAVKVCSSNTMKFVLS